MTREEELLRASEESRTDLAKRLTAAVKALHETESELDRIEDYLKKECICELCVHYENFNHCEDEDFCCSECPKKDCICGKCFHTDSKFQLRRERS